MSKKVLVATEKPFSPAAVEQLVEVFKAANYDVQLLESYTDKADLLAAVVDADAMIIRSDKVTAEVLDAAKQLKIVVRAGAGYDNIDCAEAAEKNVVAMNTPGQNSNAVAELVFGMMIMNARNNYNGKPGTEIRGKKIGIHAYGNVGIYVAKAAHGFGMEVFAFDPFVDDEAIKKDGVTPVELGRRTLRDLPVRLAPHPRDPANDELHQLRIALEDAQGWNAHQHRPPRCHR